MTCSADVMPSNKDENENCTAEYETIGDFFRDRHVLVTGASGFLGKVLVEKLLRSTDVGKIYVFLRPKRGDDVTTRMEKLIGSKLFDRLRNERPGFEKRLEAISADVTLTDAGLSAEDVSKLHLQVEVVFHCAANVRFDQKLKNAVTFNTVGTRNVLEFCEKMSRLKAFVHVSTAYCHCNKQVVNEVAYASQDPPQSVIETVKWMNDDILDTITPQLLNGQPNTYAYSKNLSEQIVTEYGTKFPVGIARPSIVTGTWKEPFPGWVENLNGPTGLMIGAGKGVIRSMHCREDYKGDFMPADVTVNCIIAMAWKIANSKSKTPLVVNVTLSNDNPITFGSALNIGRKLLMEYPLEYPLWYPDGSLKSSKFIHNLCVIFFHFLPAYFIDFLLLLLGKKPFMVRVQRKVQGGLEMLQYYTTKEFAFSNKNLHALRDSLTKYDQSVFNMDISNLDWVAYTKTVLLGTREYCLKEDPSTLPHARLHMRRMYWLDRIVSALIYGLLLWLLYVWLLQYIFVSSSSPI